MSDLVTQAARFPDGLLGWFAETSVIVAALVALATLASRVRWITPGPAARHVLWLMVMIKLVTPPLVHWPWSVPLPVAISRREASPPRRESALAGHPVRAEATVAGPGAGRGPEEAPAARDDPGARAADPGIDQRMAALAPRSGTWVASAWLVGSIALGVGQARRVLRFRRRLRKASPAPAWLTEEAERVGRRLGVRLPTILVVPRLGTPLLWCLGRPLMLVPGGLVETLKPDRWRAVVAHELAHLRRGDHWVRRLELVAGLVWWWNPLYWLARRRLDFEAELACDAWAVWASPGGRISYAESLIRICTTLSSPESPPPALGVAGNGRSFERRLKMILHDRVDRRVPVPSFLVAALLACLAVPSWTAAGAPQGDETPSAVVATGIEPVLSVTRTAVETRTVPTVTEVVQQVPREEAVDDESDEPASDREKKAKDAKAKAELDAIQQKKRAVAREMERKFGPGSDFAKKMEAMGKEMEEKFGPNSEFARKMEAMGKEMEAKFGPGSEFAREMEKRFGADSDFAKKRKDGTGEDGQDDPRKAKLKAETAARAEAQKARSEAQKARSEAQAAKARAETRARAEARVRERSTPEQRARRIEALESRIDELLQELKRLKDDASTDKEGDKR